MCEFSLNAVTFLGHIISGERIIVDPQKVVMVKRWPRPMILSDIWSFLGLAEYFTRFMEIFSSIAAPLTNLT